MGKSIGRIWVFDEQALELALRDYEAEALRAYPRRADRIRLTVMAIRDFLHSDQAGTLVMKQSEK